MRFAFPRRLAAVTMGAGIALATATPALAHDATSRATTTSLAAVRPKAGVRTALTATVTPRPNGGTVAFGVSGKAVSDCRTVALHAGRATCSVSLPAGRRIVTVRYSGYRAAFRASSGSRTVSVTPEPLVGGVGSCTTSVGALVAVDFAHWGGPIVRGCDGKPTTGDALLAAAKFSVTGTTRYGLAFVCRLGNPLFHSGAAYPTTKQDACVQTPPANAYWSYWLAPKGTNTWRFAKNGVTTQKAGAGEVQAWTFGNGAVPSFTPARARAGLPAATGHRVAVVSRHRLSTATPAPTRPNRGTAAAYLVRKLTSGTHYESSPGFADLGLTIDAAFALAATDTRDADLTKIVDYVAAHQNDYTSLSGTYAAYASGGAVGKLALLAEVTGTDPRAFHGVNLVSALDRLVCSKAVKDVCAAAGNYRYASSTFAQVLGVLGQLRAGDATGAGKSVTYLESLPNASGAFPSALPGHDADTDSTALATSALALVPSTKARGELASALHWLAGRQETDGGFPGTSGDSVNSTGLAIQALRLQARTYAKQIARALAFLAREQHADGGFAIARGGSRTGSDVRASTQALSGTVGIPFSSLIDDAAARRSAAAGATYLVSQLTDGSHYTTTYGSQTYDDQGLTADGVFALLSAGGHASTVTSMIDYLKAQVGNYADPTGAAGGPYSGGLSKLALVAEATGTSPHSFGGVDLLKIVRTKVCVKAIPGDYSPCTAKGDFYNAFSTVSQALGVLALQASPIAADHFTITNSPVIRLHQLQCADGGFSSVLIAPGATCTSDVDTTGYAVQALAAVPGTSDWLGAAQAYLQKKQKATGLFPGQSGDNANSTALATQALQTLTGSLTSYTVDMTQPETAAPVTAWQSALRGLRGLAVTGSGFGATSATTADVRATTQAVPAAAQRNLIGLSRAQVRSRPRPR